MKRIVVGIVLALGAQVLMGQTTPHVPLGIVSDWTHHHVLYPVSTDGPAMPETETDPRWVQNWYLRHREEWWPEQGLKHRQRRHRDWTVPLTANPLTSAFEPLFDFTFSIGPDTGFGSLNTTDIGNGQYFATAGSLTVTGGRDVGTYPLYPGGPAVTASPSGFFIFNNVLYPSVDPGVDVDGLLFLGGGLEINIFSNGPSNYQFYDNSGYNNVGQPFALNIAPGGGQTSPAKFVFDVNAAPSCTNDYAVIGIPANPTSGGQANIVGVNNLYSGVPGALCATGPTVMFAYASGTGQVPASLVLHRTGPRLRTLRISLRGALTSIS